MSIYVGFGNWIEPAEFPKAFFYKELVMSTSKLCSMPSCSHPMARVGKMIVKETVVLIAIAPYKADF
jgi:hypothetical protein